MLVMTEKAILPRWRMLPEERTPLARVTAVTRLIDRAADQELLSSRTMWLMATRATMATIR